MPRLFKTIKITADTHKAIKLLAANKGVSMAQLIGDWALAQRRILSTVDDPLTSISIKYLHLDTISDKIFPPE